MELLSGGYCRYATTPRSCTKVCSEHISVDAFLEYLPRAFLYIAFVAWVATFSGFAFDLIRRLRGFQA